METTLNDEKAHAVARMVILDNLIKCVQGQLPPPSLLERFQKLHYLDNAGSIRVPHDVCEGLSIQGFQVDQLLKYLDMMDAKENEKPKSDEEEDEEDGGMKAFECGNGGCQEEEG